MYVTNLNVFGRLLETDSYTTTHLHNDMWQIFDNKLVSVWFPPTFSMAWYKIVKISRVSLVSSWHTRSPKGSCLYQKIQGTRGIFCSKPLETIV